MIQERGVEANQSAIFRCVQQYPLEIVKRVHQHQGVSIRFVARG